jgi:hypothetical protein
VVRDKDVIQRMVVGWSGGWMVSPQFGEMPRQKVSRRKLPFLADVVFIIVRGA